MILALEIWGLGLGFRVGALKPSFVKGLPGDPCVQIVPILRPKVYKYGG